MFLLHISSSFHLSSSPSRQAEVEEMDAWALTALQVCLASYSLTPLLHLSYTSLTPLLHPQTMTMEFKSLVISLGEETRKIPSYALLAVGIRLESRGVHVVQHVTSHLSYTHLSYTSLAKAC
jgi:hypothetical protein